MYTVSQDFKDKIKDQTAQKSCLILFDDLYFSTADFTDNGVVFNQFFNTSEDLTFGDCPSDTLSFSVVANGALSGYGFGKCRAYLGVQTASESYAFGDINAHIEVGGYTWTASASGLYCGSTLIDAGEYVSLVSDGEHVLASGLTSAYRANIDGSNGSVWTPHRFIAQKLRSGLSAVFASNTGYVWDGENVLTYEYVPMGVYNVAKPRSTVGDVVTVQDAYDNMSLFDRDASQFLESLTYPVTLSGIYTALCDFVGVSYVSSTFTYSTTSYSSSPFSDTSCTLRDILWWIAERARCVAHFNRVGALDLMEIGTTAVETLTATDIGADGYSIAEFATPKVTGVLLKGTNGSSLTFGESTVPYVISANPFVSTITNTDLQAYWNIPTYVPIELNVLEADPSIDIGDMVDIKPMVDEIVLLTNVYNEIYVNEDLEAYALKAPTYEIPLMNREVTFMGGIRAKYVATGNEVREADISDTEYNANVAASMAQEKVDESLTQEEVFNRLTNNGQAQGIYMDANGNIYFNASYIQSGTISANYIYGGTLSGSEINIGSGAFVVDSSGNVTITKGTINLGGGVFQVSSTGAVTASNLTVTGGSITLGSSFSVTNTGVLTCSNATITGGLVNIVGTDATTPALSVEYTYSGTGATYISMLSASQITHKVTASNGSYDIAYFNKDGMFFGSATSGGVYSEYGSYMSNSFGIADSSGHGLYVSVPTNGYIYIAPVVVNTW